MVNGSQWSSLWYRDGVLVYYESAPWNGGTGGYGYTDWDPKPEDWLPGNYDVQIFVGTEFKISGQFVVTGTPIAGPTTTATPLSGLSTTGAPSGSATPQSTPSGSATPQNTPSPTFSIPSLTLTALPTGRFLITPSATPYTITPCRPGGS